MAETTLTIDDLAVPRILYGTAWKEDRTQALVELAIEQGFRGIDTANQRRHYFEEAVGRGIAAAIGRGRISREQLFLQTKFTFRPGQDHRLPYDPAAPIETQVGQSLASSLEHLGVEHVDSYVLHGPAQNVGLGAADWAAWRAMEDLQSQGKTRLLGVSNVRLEQLERLVGEARVPPRFVQNRCFAVLAWDRDVRKFCREQNIFYQGFSLLTANPDALHSAEVAAIARRHERLPTQVIFRFALDVGMIPLTGTSDAAHMQKDLEAFDFELDAGEIERIESVIKR